MTLKELRAKLTAKRDQLREVFKQVKIEANGEKTYDFARATADWLGAEVLALEGATKSNRIIDLVNQRSTELDELQDELTKRETAEQAASRLEKADRKPVNRPGSPASNTSNTERKSLGRRVTEHPLFKQWREGRTDGQIELADIGMSEMKTLFQTSAGWAPESTRTGIVVPGVTRPLQITDIVPTGATGSAAVLFMRETTRTHAAAEKAEGATYAESTFKVEEITSPVRKITDSIPVTDEQLEDVPMVESYLDSRLTFGVQQRLDKQIISGNGTAPNLEGIVSTTGINTHAKVAATTVPNEIFAMMQTVRVTGRAMPTHVVLHPDNWTPIRLLRTTDGIYVWGNPSEAGPERIFGLPVIQNESLTLHTGLVGSFLPLWIMVFERRGVIVERGFSGTDFVKGMQHIRASGRYANVVFRPAAFGTVTALDS